MYVISTIESQKILVQTDGVGMSVSTSCKRMDSEAQAIERLLLRRCVRKGYMMNDSFYSCEDEAPNVY